MSHGINNQADVKHHTFDKECDNHGSRGDKVKRKTIAVIYTGAALVSPLSAFMRELYPEHRVINILHDSLIGEVITEGGMSPSVLRRMFAHCDQALQQGADIILETCSSVGESIDLLQPFFPIPIIRIDRPMIEQALSGGGARVGVLATLPTTLGPTMRLVDTVAKEQGISVQAVSGLAQGAFEALTVGDAAKHDRLLLETAEQVAATCDCLVLAQGSMARMADELQRVTGIPVYSSPLSGVRALADFLQESGSSYSGVR